MSVMEQETRDESKLQGRSRWGIIVTLIAISAVPGIKILWQDGMQSLFGILSILLSLATIVLLLTEKKRTFTKAIQVPETLFKTSNQFNLVALGTMAILSVIYILFW
jgi:hypothetical protein